MIKKWLQNRVQNRVQKGVQNGSKTTPFSGPRKPRFPAPGPETGVPDPIDHFLVQLFVLIPLILRDPTGRVFFGVHHF